MWIQAGDKVWVVVWVLNYFGKINDLLPTQSISVYQHSLEKSGEHNLVNIVYGIDPKCNGHITTNGLHLVIGVYLDNKG